MIRVVSLHNGGYVLYNTFLVTQGSETEGRMDQSPRLEFCLRSPPQIFLVIFLYYIDIHLILYYTSVVTCTHEVNKEYP